MVPVVGLEPTRMISPTDFESVTSANSITPANLLRFSAFFRFLEIGGHGGGQKSNFSIFGCQKIPKLGDFRVSERQTEQDFLSPARLPIPSFRRFWHCNTGSGGWQEISWEGQAVGPRSQGLVSHWPWSLRPRVRTVPSARRTAVWVAPAARATAAETSE